jgi:predicted SAM-dependent methyltransferase
MLEAKEQTQLYRINVGCGMTPTKGCLNFDNSFSIRLSAFPRLSTILYKAKFIDQPQMNYILFCRQNKIGWANVTKRIPVPDNSAEVLYSSHMLEHLDRQEVTMFLAEARRVLVSGGIIRIVVPDLEKSINSYISHGDADLLIESMHVCVPRPRKLSERLRILFVGTRHHQWMYDSKSLCRLMNNSGFTEARNVPAGETRIKNPAPLDLCERMDESVYVEAIKA